MASDNIHMIKTPTLASSKILAQRLYLLPGTMTGEMHGKLI